MPWFKLSDGAAFHRKVLAAGNEAFGAWCRAGSWSSAPDNLTDGLIPPEVAASIAPPRVWARLRAVGLIEAPEGGGEGEQIHAFTEYNPSAEQVKAKRAATRKRVENWRGNAVGNGVTGGVTDVFVTPPPARASRPDPVPIPSQPDGARDPDARAESPIGELSTLAQQLADEGVPIGVSVVDAIAAGRTVTAKQREALRRIAAERANPGPGPRKTMTGHQMPAAPGKRAWEMPEIHR